MFRTVLAFITGCSRPSLVSITGCSLQQTLLVSSFFCVLFIEEDDFFFAPRKKRTNSNDDVEFPALLEMIHCFYEEKLHTDLCYCD